MEFASFFHIVWEYKVTVVEMMDENWVEWIRAFRFARAEIYKRGI
jgi:hypothetical protein